jgi:putative tryptophan/tyrosine transport system substrate-binding protein
VPKASRVAVLMWPGAAEVSFHAAETAARSIGVELLRLEVSEYADLDRAFEIAANGRADALLVMGGPLLFGLRKRITQLALKHCLPALYHFPSFAREGGLLVYGPGDTEIYGRAAWYVDKILNGAKPNDLSVEQPTKFELILNLRTARSLGITIPTSIMVRADEIRYINVPALRQAVAIVTNGTLTARNPAIWGMARRPVRPTPSTSATGIRT